MNAPRHPIRRCAVFGASGGVGGAAMRHLCRAEGIEQVFAGSRDGRAGAGEPHVVPFRFDLEDEKSLADAAGLIASDGAPDLVFVATGILQCEPDIRPERSWSALDAEALAALFRINTIGPALIAKHVLPRLATGERAVFAALSARVGSIGDNALGGWHGYRASKAALNMMIRNFAIELRRRNPAAIAVALHPGTVETGLSAPFARNVPERQLFSPERAASQLLEVIDALNPGDSGGFFAWDGTWIEY